MMSEDKEFHDKKSDEKIAQAFLEPLFKDAGYKIVPFGVENHIQDLLTALNNEDPKNKNSMYSNAVNNHIRSMPDWVILDGNDCSLVEIKLLRNKQKFPNTYMFATNHIEWYIEWWKDEVLLIVTDVPPYCYAIDVKEIKAEFYSGEYEYPFSKGKRALWDFRSIRKPLSERFPKITQKMIDENGKHDILKR